MDFGLMGMEEGQHQQGGSPEPSSKRKFSGSGFLNQEGSVEDDQSRASKMAANAPDLGLLKQMPLLRSTSSCVGGPPQSQMLSFSSPTSGGGGGGGGGGGKSTAPVHPRNAGYASGSIHGSFTGIRGPFTPAQWIELEHQALIYKYFTANVPVPATLLFPIRKALVSSGFPGFSAHSYGWGSFHLGYSCSSTDPEPGRCRRTDGKKWRCSRDAVPDQKYCERHINRGRHRSRKPVEGQTGHQAISRPTNPKVVPTSSSATSSGNSSNNLAIAAHQLTNLQVSAPSLATDSVVNRLQDSQGFSMMPSSKASPFPVPKQHVPYEEPRRSEFGFVSSESLLNPSPRANLNCQTYNSFLSFNDQHTQDQHQIHPLVDESNHSTLPWPNELKPDWTQLSMSTPMSELSSSSNQEKALNEAGSNWAPMSWGKPMGGPLGEVLNNNADSSLNPTTDGYDGSPQFDSSPTGVLQKGASVSLSNSASGSSPRGESRMAHEGDCLGDDEMLGSAHATSPSIPAP